MANQSKMARSFVVGALAGLSEWGSMNVEALLKVRKRMDNQKKTTKKKSLIQIQKPEKNDKEEEKAEIPTVSA